MFGQEGNVVCNQKFTCLLYKSKKNNEINNQLAVIYVWWVPHRGAEGLALW